MISFHRIDSKRQEKYISWKSDAKHGRNQWMDESKVCEEYYYHDVDNTKTLYTQRQLEIIKNATNIPVSINWLHPVANQKLAILTQTKPSTRVVSLDGRAKKEAFVLDKIKHGILYASDASAEIEEATKEMLISGLGAVMLTASDFYTKGMFGLKLMHIPKDEILLDINARKRDLSDMEGFFFERQYTLPKAQQLYGGIVEQLTDEQGNPIEWAAFTGESWVEGEVPERVAVSTGNWDTNERVTVREYYEKVYTTMYGVPDEETGVVDYYFAENLTPIEQTVLVNAVTEVKEIYIKKIIYLGDFQVWEEILPITEWPLQVMIYEWGGRPYNSYGMIHFDKDKQEAYDKVLQIMILNGILTNNSGWNGPKGSVPEGDKPNWEQYGNNPLYYKEWIPIVRENQVLKPERDEVPRLGDFYPMLLDLLQKSIEYSTGITPILQGNARESGVEVFSSLQQYQNAAMMRIVMATTHINQTMQRVGNCLLDYIKANLHPDTYLFLDEKGSLNEIKIAKDIVNNIKSFKFTVLAIPATAMPTQRLAVGTELMKIAQSSPDPHERSLYTQKAMELSDIKEFDELREQLDVVKNTESKFSQLQEAYNRLMETSKQMENKYINISLENKVLKATQDAQLQTAVATQKAVDDIELAKELEKGKIEGEQKK